MADTKDLAFEKSKYFSKYSVHLIEIRNNFSTKKEHIVVLNKQWISSVEIQIWGKFPNPLFIFRKEKIMATTKIWKVQKRLDHVINYTTNEEKTKNNYSEYGMDRFDSIIQVMTYATNPDKTEKQFYTTGINCEVKNSVKQMQLIKMIYGKENGILAFHAYQSFDEGEVTPEIAHEIGVKLANKMWGDRFQVVVSTH